MRHSMNPDMNQVLGKSLLLCVKELRQLPLEAQKDRQKQPKELVERVDAAWSELSFLFHVARPGTDRVSNLWGWTKKIRQLDLVFYEPWYYRQGFNWDAIESDVKTLGRVLEYEFHYNSLMPKSNCELRQMAERGFSYHRVDEVEVRKQCDTP